MTRETIEFHIENVEKAIHRHTNDRTRENARISLGVLSQLAFTALRYEEGGK